MRNQRNHSFKTEKWIFSSSWLSGLLTRIFLEGDKQALFFRWIPELGRGSIFSYQSKCFSLFSPNILYLIAFHWIIPSSSTPWSSTRKKPDSKTHFSWYYSFKNTLIEVEKLCSKCVTIKKKAFYSKTIDFFFQNIVFS